MEKTLKKLIQKAYKNRFSLYFNGKFYKLRTYNKQGSQSSEEAEDLVEVINKMLKKIKKNGRKSAFFT